MSADRDAAQPLGLVLAHLHEGTDSRTGSGTTLTADQCRLLLDEIRRLEAENEIAWREVASNAGV